MYKSDERGEMLLLLDEPSLVFVDWLWEDL
jgi:hypothetical protein